MPQAGQFPDAAKPPDHLPVRPLSGKHWDPRCELDKASDLVQKLQRRQPVSFAEERVTKIYKHDYTVTTEEGLDATRAVVIFTDFGTRMVMVEKMVRAFGCGGWLRRR